MKAFSNPWIFSVLILSAAVVFTTRALPFVIFRGGRRMPDWLTRLGDMLPSAIMAVLIIYCLKDIPGDPAFTGIHQLAAVLVVAVSYKLKHSIFLSILLGTVTNMALIQLLTHIQM